MQADNLNISTETMHVPEASIPMLFGYQDRYLKYITMEIGAKVTYVGGNLTIIGVEAAVGNTKNIISHLLGIMVDREINEDDVTTAIKMVKNQEADSLHDVTKERIKVSGTQKYVTPKSKNQRYYVKQMQEKDMIFSYGPAGTGKTFLAVSLAVHYYLEKKVDKIILTRPAVEAGEKLGFLPGDLADKINPYLRPLYDALNSMLHVDLVVKLMEKGVIEVAPLAFMRGRTLSNAFVILDEAQNTTPAQMKMFLTRLGFGSKAVITGDITQIDLPVDQGSGLIDAIKLLKHIEEIGFVELSSKDVVRHPLVSKIIEAYADDDSSKRR